MKTNAELLKELDSYKGKALLTEPSLAVGVTTSAVMAVVTVILRQFTDMDDEAILTLTTALFIIIPVVQGAITRKEVWSPTSVKKVVAASIERENLF